MLTATSSWKKQGRASPLEPQERCSTDTLIWLRKTDFRLLAFRIVRDPIFSVVSYKVCDTLLLEPQETNISINSNDLSVLNEVLLPAPTNNDKF